jgi:hypothetical protein
MVVTESVETRLDSFTGGVKPSIRVSGKATFLSGTVKH